MAFAIPQNGEAVRERIRSIVAEDLPTFEAFFVRWSADGPSDVPRARNGARSERFGRFRVRGSSTRPPRVATATHR